MNVSRFIAKRLRFEGRIAMVSIAVSFFVMILAVAISSGFRNELRDGIAVISGDVRLTPPDMNYLGESSPISADSSFVSEMSGIDAVASVDGVVYRAGIAKTDENIHGVLFKGVPDGGDSLKVSIPVRLSEILDLNVGDDLPVYFIGERVKVRRFKIASTYESVLSGDDNLIILAGLKDMQRLNGWSEEQVSAIEIGLEPAFRDAEKMQEATREIGAKALNVTPEMSDAPVAASALDRFPQIFSWLDLIDFNVLLILVLMTIVAGFNMISGLLILLFRNISTIGTLKSLGMTDKTISELFLRVASSLVLKGMAIGNGLALLFCLIQGSTHLISLNPENYFISFVPVDVDILHILAADAVSYLAIMILLLIPCLFVSRVDPAKTVRVQ